VAESGTTRRDESVRPASGVTRFYQSEQTPNSSPPAKPIETSTKSIERFNW
jgi:hypothetical protein